jgi:hypothetical protein
MLQPNRRPGGLRAHIGDGALQRRLYQGLGQLDRVLGAF